MPIVTGEHYHVFNRGVASTQIFTNYFDKKRFIKTMLYYQIEDTKPRFSLYTPTTSKLNLSNKLVDIICYCLMPNHFHFLLKQNRDKGISEFISKVTNSYTKYFNIKFRRYGPLFQGMFKAVHIETDEQLTHLSRYIHLNPLVGFVTKDLDSYQWSSYRDYIGLNKSSVCAKNIVLGQFKSTDDYRGFVLDQEDYAKELENQKHQLLDYPKVQSQITPEV